MRKEQTTIPGTPCPTLYDKCVGSFTPPADRNAEDAGDGANGSSPFPRRLEYLTIFR